MEIFHLTLQQMLMMFALMLVGFVLRKCAVIPDNAGTVMSRLETYAFVPALSLFTQITKCNVENFTKNAPLMLYGLVIVLVGVAVAYPLSRMLVRRADGNPSEEYRRNVYRYSMTFGNYGFMGNFIVLGVFGTDMFYRYSLFTFFVGVVCTSWGLYILVPKEKGAGLWKNLKNGLLKPPFLALVLGILLGLLDVKRFLPDFVMTALERGGDCQGPVAMVLAGFVVGGYRFRDLLADKKVYLATFLRLIAIPSVLMLVLHALGVDKTVMTLALICFATPLGLNTIVYPAAFGGETKTGAAMATISHTLSVVTIPLMYLVFIVWL